MDATDRCSAHTRGVNHLHATVGLGHQVRVFRERASRYAGNIKIIKITATGCLANFYALSDAIQIRNCHNKFL